ncbi:unnamed protein product [Meganyctiphanes norvegica]|uniref:Uncharacterized protein n=1 Tax=Meganyctiphanes norvegica TaxID=48144 RepID=A0AAV2R8B0_MEGNR
MCLGQAGDEEICGQAMICFNDDRTGFQGSIKSEDNTMYVITGAKSKKRRNANNEGMGYSYLMEGEEQLGMPIFYDIRVVDCDIGEEYNLKRVRGSIGENATFNCNCLSFTVDNIYIGQKADMMVQQLLGHSMEGFHKSVQTGYISMRCSVTSNNSHWVL